MKTRALTIISFLLVLACHKQSPVAPSPQTDQGRTIGSAIVTIQMTYTCHPCTSDPDNYEFRIEGGDHASRRAGTTAETDTVTWTGHLSPGAHRIEITIVNAETSWRLVFLPTSAAGNIGGIRASTIKPFDNSSTIRDSRAIGRCDMNTMFTARPPSFYNLLVGFEVVADSASSVC